MYTEKTLDARLGSDLLSVLIARRQEVRYHDVPSDVLVLAKAVCFCSLPLLVL